MFWLLLYLSPGIIFGLIIATYFWTRLDFASLVQTFAIMLGCTLAFAISALAILFLSTVIEQVPSWVGSRLVAAFMIASLPGSLAVAMIFCTMLERQTSSLRHLVEMAGCAAAGVLLGGAVAPLCGQISNETSASAWGLPIAVWQIGMAVVLGTIAEGRARRHARMGTRLPRFTA